MLYNGFGDHYLQDSFASGHLVNKTLVMQWYMEEMKSWWLMGPRGRKWIRFQQMSLTNQPDLAPKDYSKVPGTRAHNPQAAANVDTPQESWEIMGLQSIKASKEAKARLAAMRASGYGTKRLTADKWAKVRHGAYPDFPGPQAMVRYLRELAGLGVCVQETPEKKPTIYGLTSVDAPKDHQQVGGQDTAMQTVTANIYHQWLNSALIQAGSGALHDHFCKQGLWVSSTADGELFKIYGDDRLLTAGAGDGVAYAAETAQLSRDNIADTLAGGQQRAGELKLSRILDRFPA